jgi:hypothetical protein
MGTIHVGEENVADLYFLSPHKQLLDFITSLVCAKMTQQPMQGRW